MSAWGWARNIVMGDGALSCPAQILDTDTDLDTGTLHSLTATPQSLTGYKTIDSSAVCSVLHKIMARCSILDVISLGNLYTYLYTHETRGLELRWSCIAKIEKYRWLGRYLPVDWIRKKGYLWTHTEHWLELREDYSLRPGELAESIHC